MLWQEIDFGIVSLTANSRNVFSNVSGVKQIQQSLSFLNCIHLIKRKNKGKYPKLKNIYTWIYTQMEPFGFNPSTSLVLKTQLTLKSSLFLIILLQNNAFINSECYSLNRRTPDPRQTLFHLDPNPLEKVSGSVI